MAQANNLSLSAAHEEGADLRVPRRRREGAGGLRLQLNNGRRTSNRVSDDWRRGHWIIDGDSETTPRFRYCATDVKQNHFGLGEQRDELKLF